MLVQPPPLEGSSRTRATIVAAAAKSFARNGYPGSPVNSIIEASGSTKGAFYFHFESKAALAATIVQGMHAAWAPAVAHWAERDCDALHVVLGLVDELVGLCANNDMVRAGMRLVDEYLLLEFELLSPYPEWERIFGHLFHRAAKEKILGRAVQPGTAARVLVAAVAGELHLSSLGTSSGELRSRVDTVLLLLLPALASPEWAAQWRRSGWLQRA